MTTTEMVAVAGLVINAGAIVWGAAKLSSAVTHLEKTVIEIKAIVMSMQETVHNMIGRIWVIEDRLQIKYKRRSTDSELEITDA